MNHNTIFRRGLATSSGAGAITLASWCGEGTAASRIGSSVNPVSALRHWQSASRHEHSSIVYSGLARQQRFFSSSKVVPPAAPEATVKKAATSTASKNTSGGGGFVAWYEGHLDARPILTKSITGSILWGVGDVVAQVFPHLSEGTMGSFQYDWMRTGRAVTFGGVIHAPTSHVHFNFLEWMTVKSGLSGLAIPVFKTVMEQFVYWSWISNSLYHAGMGAMQGQGPQEIYDRIADLLMDMQKAQWAFWIPVQLINFNFVPVRHQLNVVLLTSIVWTALLSMWYPPIEESIPEVSKPE